MNYKWEPKDDLIAFLLFKLAASGTAIEKASQEIGCPVRSLRMRIQNIEFLKHGTGNLDHASAQTKDIFNKFDPIL